jgi:hypothetical protein
MEIAEGGSGKPTRDFPYFKVYHAISPVESSDKLEYHFSLWLDGLTPRKYEGKEPVGAELLPSQSGDSESIKALLCSRNLVEYLAATEALDRLRRQLNLGDIRSLIEKDRFLLNEEQIEPEDWLLEHRSHSAIHQAAMLNALVYSVKDLLEWFHSNGCAPPETDVPIPGDLTELYVDLMAMVEGKRLRQDLDTLKERMRRELELAKLPKGKTVPPKKMYVIAQRAKVTGIEKVLTPDQFTGENPAYRLAFKYASELGYKKARPRSKES